MVNNGHCFRRGPRSAPFKPNGDREKPQLRPNHVRPRVTGLQAVRVKSIRVFQILRDGQLQSRRDRRQQTQSGYGAGRRLHSELQARESHHVRLGDPGQTVGRRRLHPGQRAQRFFDQPVSRVPARRPAVYA